MIGNIDWSLLVSPICKAIEHSYDVKLKIDLDALRELDAIAARTIGGYNIRHPNSAKVAGHVVFWFRGSSLCPARKIRLPSASR